MKTLHPNQVAIIETSNKRSNPIFTTEFKPEIIKVTSNEKFATNREILVEEINQNHPSEKNEISEPVLKYEQPNLNFLNDEEKNRFSNLSLQLQNAFRRLSTMDRYKKINQINEHSNRQN